MQRGSTTSLPGIDPIFVGIAHGTGATRPADAMPKLVADVEHSQVEEDFPRMVSQHFDCAAVLAWRSQSERLVRFCTHYRLLAVGSAPAAPRSCPGFFVTSEYVGYWCVRPVRGRRPDSGSF